MVENFRIHSIRLIQSGLGTLIAVSSHNQQFIETLDGGYDNPHLKHAPKHREAISQAEREIQLIIDLSTAALKHLQCAHIDYAIKALGWWLQHENRSWSDLKSKSIALRDAIEVELQEYFYYQYPKPKGQKLRAWRTEWETIIASFPSCEHDIFSATDCYALGHSTAAVFHCMRILERGISAIASDVGLSFDLQQWHNILEQIEAKIAETRKTLPRGSDRNARLQFLSEAAKEFFYFKDGWRNYVSHNRGHYEEHQALSILEHTRSFMGHLASRLSDQA